MKVKDLSAVYRFFGDPAHANDLADGSVWLSTLDKCRNHENELARDGGEARHTYAMPETRGGSDDPGFVEMASRALFEIGPGCSNITLNGVGSEVGISDGFVLCTTESFSPDKLGPKFGAHCVKITNPVVFFEFVHRALMKVHPYLRYGEVGRVAYRARDYTGLGNAPGPLGFVKPDTFKDEQEIRFLWGVSDQRIIKPFMLKVPNVKYLCRRIA